MKRRFLPKGSPFSILLWGVAFVALVSIACSVPSVDLNPNLNQGSPNQGNSTVFPGQIGTTQPAPTPFPGQAATQQSVPTFTPAPATSSLAGTALPQTGNVAVPGNDVFAKVFQDTHKGVVSIVVYITQQGQAGQAAGSGFVIDNQGHIVTNNHVVQGAQNVFVTFYDGNQVPAKVIGTDPQSDLAVIQVNNTPDGVHALKIGNSDNVQVGEQVVALGNPFAVGISESAGIVSAVGRVISSLTSFSIPQAIQTDAAINPGNSGGPLINLSGEVVGVNAQIATNGNNQGSGVGFAIPSNIVRKVAPALIKNGSYTWPWLGVVGASVDYLLQQANNLPTQNGAYIDSVTPGSPAAKASLQGSTGQTTVDGQTVPTGGDVVVAMDNQPVNNFEDLMVDTAYKNPGDQVTLTVLRNGKKVQVPLTLGARPNNVNNNPSAP